MLLMYAFIANYNNGTIAVNPEAVEFPFLEKA
jgi:hypothetical protein